MTNDLSKYVFDINNPKGFAAYGLLKKIFKEQNILLVIDLFFFNELFKKEIWTPDVVDEIWDKPDNFEELSSNDKMDVYVERFSKEDYFDVVDKKSHLIKQNPFIRLKNSYFLGFEDISPKSTEKQYYFKLKINTEIDIRRVEDALMINTYDKGILSWWEVEKVESTLRNMPLKNVIFLISEKYFLPLLRHFEIKKVSSIIVPFKLKEDISRTFLPQNTHPIFLKNTNDLSVLFDLAIRDAKYLYPSKIKNTLKSYLKKIQIKNYYTLENITLNQLQNKKEIYILGENGDGKTLLLQAILISAKWHQIKNQSDKSITGVILQQVEENPKLFLECQDTTKGKYSFSKNTTTSFENIYAYGVNRQDNRADTDEYGYMTLFKKDIFLQEPTKWLQYLYTKDLEGSHGTIDLEAAKELLNDLLEKKVAISVSADGVKFTERGSENVKFDQLSDGYKSILIWVCDLVSRLSRNQPNISRLEDFHGVVLVDEIGLHLHPKWEAQLVQKLRNWFKNIQFIFTTHSPVMILNASKEAVFYRLYKEEGVTKISDQYQCDEFSDLMANGLITSPLFDLDSATMKSYEPAINDLDTSENYRSGRVRKLVEKEYQKLKEEGTTFISPAMIDNMIEKVLQDN